MKRIVRTVLMVVCLLGAAAGAALWSAGQVGSSPVEAWVAGQINLVAEAYLVPKLTFSDLDYEFPSTVRLRDLRLTADDPANAGRTIDILAADRATIELTAVPQPGEPVQIASVVLIKPLFQAVRVGGTSTELVGFSNLLKQTAKPGAPRNDTTALVPRMSEFIRVRQIELIDGRLVSDPRLAGVPPMELDQINTSMAIEREGGGWYALTTRIARQPVFNLAIIGRVNLDTFVAREATVTLEAQVGRGNDGYLPSALQAFLGEHEVQGALEAKLTGDLPLLDPARGRMEAVLALRDANVSFGDVRLPIESLRMNASLADGLMNLSSTRLEALRGSAEASGSLRLNDRLDADLALRVNNMILDDTIRDGTRSARDPKYGGRMSAQINGSASLRGVLGHLGAETPARNLAATLESRDGALTTSSAITEPLPARWGDGRIEIDQGRLMFIPLVRILGNSIARGRSLLTGRGAQGRGTDRATVVFDLCGAEARCEEITYVGAIFAARGRGRVGFDQILDLTVNAGPLEKMQSMMGNRVGRVFGRVTDALASYRVRGTIAEPKVQVRLAGDSVRRAGSAVKSGVGRAVDAVGNFTNAKGDADE